MKQINVYVDHVPKSNSQLLHAEVLREIDYNKRWIDSLTSLEEIVICVKYDRKTREPRFVHLTIETEREITRTTS